MFHFWPPFFQNVALIKLLCESLFMQTLRFHRRISSGFGLALDWTDATPWLKACQCALVCGVCLLVFIPSFVSLLRNSVNAAWPDFSPALAVGQTASHWALEWSTDDSTVDWMVAGHSTPVVAKPVKILSYPLHFYSVVLGVMHFDLKIV